MRLLLAGQPNSGKSTIFNAVAGYRSATANFPGSTVSYTQSRAIVLGREVEVVDLPGMFSLTGSDGMHAEALELLVEGPSDDVIIDVVDASRLGRSLELTLQLLELGRPMVIALNMMDEARRRGIELDVAALQEEIGVPVVPTIGRRGRGLRQLFRTAVEVARGARPVPLQLDREVETAVALTLPVLAAAAPAGPPPRLNAIRLLEGDQALTRAVAARSGAGERVAAVRAQLAEAHGWSAEQVVSGSRHSVAHAIEDRVTSAGPPRLGWREAVDRVLLHPWTGGPLMVLILAAFFWGVFGLGRVVEAPLVAFFESVADGVRALFATGSLTASIAHGAVMGVAAGSAVVLPYLVPFLLGLAVLEDTGYLPRMAYILDSLMHRLGLHGKSVVPLTLGYGCSVPAIMATRILESPRDRRLTAALTAFIPCSARTVVIYALVAAYLGPLWAMSVYVLNLVVVVLLGRFLTRRMAGRSPGLILEIPELRAPELGSLLNKTWMSLKEFIVVAWPLLVASSVVLAVLSWMGIESWVNLALSPLTVTLLGLPAAVGVTLVFGVLRKELMLVMLMQALGTADVSRVLDPVQLMTLTLFVVFYVPCVATLAAIGHELGWRDAAWITGLTLVVATVVAVLARVGLALIL